MIDDENAVEQDAISFWFKALITDNVTLIGCLALIALVGHKSLGWREFGIRSFHLFAIAIAGVLAIWVGTLIVKRRLHNQSNRRLRDAGFTDDEIAELDAEYRAATKWCDPLAITRKRKHSNAE